MWSHSHHQLNDQGMPSQIVDKFVIVVAAIKTQASLITSLINGTVTEIIKDSGASISLITTTLAKQVNATSNTANMNIQLVNYQ